MSSSIKLSDSLSVSVHPSIALSFQTEKFAAEHPLECNNQAAVYTWINTMLTHHCLPGVKVEAVNPQAR
jgi:hypothetical protein